MENRTKTILTYSAIIIVSLFFFFWGLVKAKSFLAPIAVAALLAMVILPVAQWLENKGLSRGWASLLSTLIILLFFVGLGWVISAQVKGFVQQWPKIKETALSKADQLERFIEKNTGVQLQNSEQILGQAGGVTGAGKEETAPNTDQQGAETPSPSQQSSQTQMSGSSILTTAGSFISRFLGFLGTFLLIFVYIFFFLLYRRKFKKSIIKLTPDEKQDETEKIITESAKVSQSYLFGRLILIIILSVLYSIGLTISGVQQAILVSVLAAVLTLIPYIGNIVGYLLAVGLAFFSGSGVTGAIGVTITFAVTQFVESYILTPYIVGDKVNLNPVFTIIVVVLGSAVWGILGMLIAIPALGIAKVVFDNIPPLEPLGYMFGEEDTKSDSEGDSVFDKTKRWALNKFKSRNGP